MANTEDTNKPPVKKPVTKQPVKPPVKKTADKNGTRTYGVPKYDKPEEQQWGPYRIDRRAYEEAKAAAQTWHKERMAAGEGPLVGTARRAAILENLEPYMGDWTYLPERRFPGLVADYPRSYDAPTGAAPQPEPRHGGGRGYIPPPPVVDEMKVRSAPGIRRSPYWESEDPYTQTFAPRFVVLGSNQSW